MRRFIGVLVFAFAVGWVLIAADLMTSCHPYAGVAQLLRALVNAVVATGLIVLLIKREQRR